MAISGRMKTGLLHPHQSPLLPTHTRLPTLHTYTTYINRPPGRTWPTPRAFAPSWTCSWPSSSATSSAGAMCPRTPSTRCVGKGGWGGQNDAAACVLGRMCM